MRFRDSIFARLLEPINRRQFQTVVDRLDGDAYDKQILAAMIAYLLLRIAARSNCVTLLPLRFAELVGQLLFTRRTIAQIEKPPPLNPSKPKPAKFPHQMEFCYG